MSDMESWKQVHNAAVNCVWPERATFFLGENIG